MHQQTTNNATTHGNSPSLPCPPPPFDVRAAYIVSLPLSGLLFGLSLATFGLSVRYICNEPFSKFTRARWVTLIVSTAMVMIGAMSIGQAIRHNLNAFVYYEGLGGAAEALNNPKDPTNYIHSVSYPIQTFLGNSVLIYRTWFLYDRQLWVLVIPIILLVGDMVAGFGITFAELQLTSGTFTDPAVAPYILAFFSIEVCLTVFCTGMIIARVWSIRRHVGGAITSNSLVSLVVRVIVESGIIYTATSIIILITVMAHSDAMYPTTDSFIQIAPICFHLIIFRTAWSQERSGPHFDSMIQDTNTHTLALRRLEPVDSDVPQSQPRLETVDIATSRLGNGGVNADAQTMEKKSPSLEDERSSSYAAAKDFEWPAGQSGGLNIRSYDHSGHLDFLTQTVN